MFPNTMTPIDVQTETILDERKATFTPEKELSLLDLVVLVLARKRFIARFVAGTALLAIIVSLVWPVRYEAKVVLLPPEQNSSVGSALLGQLGNMGALGSLASFASGTLGLKNPAEMYVSILSSRTVEDAMINHFGLMQEYHKKRMSDARKELEHRTTISAGTRDGLIRLSILDGNADRAAVLANGYVDQFRRLSADLAITEASRRRRFYQEEVDDTKNKLAAAEDAMTKTQESTGVLQIDSQARTLIESAAVLRAQVVAKEVEIEGMRSFATDDNPNVILAKQQLAALQAQLQRISASESDTGSDLNLSKGRATKEGMEYIRRYRDLKYQETMFELLSKEYEVAKLDEAQEGSIIQVVDAAVPPDKKASPRRVLIVICATIVGFLIAVFWVFLQDRFDTAAELPENRQRLRDIKRLSRFKSNGA
jgi:tyrosine-protein kinase Etk/Wzc